MKKILVIGCPGSGKTTFAKKLSKVTGIELIHLDKLFWCGDWTHITRDEFDILLQDALDKDSWIIDGNYSRTLPTRLKYADTVFCFRLPRLLCLYRATLRVIKNYGKIRDDMGGNCIHKFDKNLFGLYKEIMSYNKKNNTKADAQIINSSNANIIFFRNKRDIENYLNKFAQNSCV